MRRIVILGLAVRSQTYICTYGVLDGPLGLLPSDQVYGARKGAAAPTLGSDRAHRGGDTPMAARNSKLFSAGGVPAAENEKKRVRRSATRATDANASRARCRGDLVLCTSDVSGSSCGRRTTRTSSSRAASTRRCAKECTRRRWRRLRFFADMHPARPKLSLTLETRVRGLNVRIGPRREKQRGARHSESAAA